VWGIGASIDRLDAIKRLYSIKKRKETKATAVLVDNLLTANRFGVISQKAEELTDKFLAGRVDFDC